MKVPIPRVSDTIKRATGARSSQKLPELRWDFQTQIVAPRARELGARESVAEQRSIGVGPHQRARFDRPRIHRTLWAIGVLTFGLGDVAMTAYLFLYTPFSEGNPLLAAAFDAHGIWVLLPLKIVGFAVFYGLYRVVPREWQVGVPIGVLLVGSVVSVWNLYMVIYGAMWV